jgi:hypothetical protein
MVIEFFCKRESSVRKNLAQLRSTGHYEMIEVEERRMYGPITPRQAIQRPFRCEAGKFGVNKTIAQDGPLTAADSDGQMTLPKS